MSISERNVVIIGKDGSGKRTLGNRIVGGDIFQNETALGTGVHYREVKTGGTLYRILTINTGSLRTVDDTPVPYIQSQFQQVHLIIFAIPYVPYTDESHASLMRAVESFHQQAESISALVITYCENKTGEEREAIIAKIKGDARGSQVVAFMQLGTHAVGFPDLATLPPDGKLLQSAIDSDEKAIRNLVERCEVPLSTKSLSIISRNVVILGKVGSLKRTLGNHIIGKNIFPNVDAHYGEAWRGNTFYRILTIDTESLQPGYCNPIPDIQRKFQEIHSIIFVIPHYHNTAESCGSLMHVVESFHPKVKSVSALVITHCEGMTDEEREAIIAEFRDDDRISQIVTFMQHKTHVVGFPDLSTSSPDGILNAIDRDEETLRKLVEGCEFPLSTKCLAISQRNVAILGNVGSGKRTLGNHIAGRDIFQREAAFGQRRFGTHYGEVRRGDTFYRILTVDTECLQTSYNNPIGLKFQEIHSIIFAIPHGSYADESYGSLVHAVESFHQQATSISTLVITHCEGMTDEQRDGIIAEFRNNTNNSQVVDFMQHGTHAVGFPDLTTLSSDRMPIVQQSENAIDKDEEAIRKLVEVREIPMSTKNLFISRNVVILGKVGAGKRTLGNHIAGTDIFPHETTLGTGNISTHYGEARRGYTCYRILTVDTESLQSAYNNPIPNIQQTFHEIHSIIFVIPHGRYTDESHGSLMHAIKSFQQEMESVSALVITHCEGMTDEKRGEIITEFRDDTRSSQVAAFMRHKTHAVGFPDLSTSTPILKPILQNAIDKDEENIRKLVENCDLPLSTKSFIGQSSHQSYSRPSTGNAIKKQAKEARGHRQKQSDNCNVL